MGLDALGQVAFFAIMRFIPNMATMDSSANWTVLNALLDRQQLRRQQGIPTMTVLAGPLGAGVHAWKSWNRGRAAPVVVSGPDVSEAINSWMAAVVANGELFSGAARWLERMTGSAADEVVARLSRSTLHDVDRFFEAIGVNTNRDVPAAVCQALLVARSSSEAPDAMGNARQLWTQSRSRGESAEHLLAGVCSLLDPGRLPAFLIVPHQSDLERAARLLGALTGAVPALPAALAVPEELVETALRHTPDSRWQTLVREGLVKVEGLNRAEFEKRLEAAGVAAAPLSASIQRLTSEGVAADAVDYFVDAARHSTEPETEEEEDQSRSAAERFLFELLESLPQTTGLFRLNQRMEFKHGAAAAEADLLSADHKLVIEVDGSYYHLSSKDAYRRDRRKDWLFQQHGYVVLRFLADDVVRLLEEILTTILAALELRRAGNFTQQGPAS